WAPHAERVFVAGEWNGMPQSADELARQGGDFTGVVSGAGVGQRYRYVLATAAQTVTQADPRARQTAVRDRTRVIVDPGAFDFRPYTPPPVAEQVIYELHVGTFNV